MNHIRLIFPFVIKHALYIYIVYSLPTYAVVASEGRLIRIISEWVHIIFSWFLYKMYVYAYMSCNFDFSLNESNNRQFKCIVIFVNILIKLFYVGFLHYLITYSKLVQ